MTAATIVALALAADLAALERARAKVLEEANAQSPPPDRLRVLTGGELINLRVAHALGLAMSDDPLAVVCEAFAERADAVEAAFPAISSWFAGRLRRADRL